MLTNTLPLVEGSKTKPLGLLWLDCSYPVVTRGLVEILREEASIIYRYEPKKDRTPSVVVFCHNGEGVDQEVKRLQSLVPSAPVLILGLHNDPALVRIAIRAGARGFIHLGMQSKQIVRALALASEGEIVVPRELIAELIKGEESPDLLVLTTRQREILNLVGEGLTNAQIAERLFLSEYTVKQHLRAAYKLLGVRNRTEAARLLKTSAWHGRASIYEGLTKKPEEVVMLSPMLGNHENVTLLWLDDNADTQRTLLAVRPLHATRAEAIRAIC